MKDNIKTIIKYIVDEFDINTDGEFIDISNNVYENLYKIFDRSYYGISMYNDIINILKDDLKAAPDYKEKARKAYNA